MWKVYGMNFSPQFFKMRLRVSLSLQALFLFAMMHAFPVQGKEPRFGYISYSTYNIGDDIQALAAMRFLPSNALPINRESIGVFSSSEKVRAIVNGWFMHTKYNVHYHSSDPAPQRVWPLAPCIDPLLISIHLSPDFLPIGLSPEGVEYLKQHGPVGARDLWTLHELSKRQIPCYFSGCLTLTLKNRASSRENIIYAVDVDDDCVRYIQSKTGCLVKTLSHEDSKFGWMTNEQRLEYAEKLLSLYRTAKCVVTTRLHAALPCLALKTPVIFILRNEEDPRFFGLKELTRHGSREDFLQGKIPFDFDNPPKNPKRYVSLRKRMITIVTKWVKGSSHETSSKR